MTGRSVKYKNSNGEKRWSASVQAYGTQQQHHFLGFIIYYVSRHTLLLRTCAFTHSRISLNGRAPPHRWRSSYEFGFNNWLLLFLSIVSVTYAIAEDSRIANSLSFRCFGYKRGGAHPHRKWPIAMVVHEKWKVSRIARGINLIVIVLWQTCA